MKLRKLSKTLENMERDLAKMDDETFFALLGTSIEELKQKSERNGRSKQRNVLKCFNWHL